MLADRLFGRNDVMVERTLDALALRMQTLSNNIANANTPGHVRQDVAFEDALREAYDATPKHAAWDPGRAPTPLEAFLPKHVPTPLPQRLDGNTSSVELEMSQMVETAMAYNVMLRRTGFSTLKTIIQNGK